jgi:hypothetical protein
MLPYLQESHLKRIIKEEVEPFPRRKSQRENNEIIEA